MGVKEDVNVFESPIRAEPNGPVVLYSKLRDSVAFQSKNIMYGYVSVGMDASYISNNKNFIEDKFIRSRAMLPTKLVSSS